MAFAFFCDARPDFEKDDVDALPVRQAAQVCGISGGQLQRRQASELAKFLSGNFRDVDSKGFLVPFQ